MHVHVQGTERAFVLRCKESFIRHKNFLPHKGNAPEFTIKHYAGDVSSYHCNWKLRSRLQHLFYLVEMNVIVPELPIVN